jgi:hypothetical protein
MKTHKETAVELVEKFYNAKDEDGFHSMNKFRAKQCALIDIQGKIELLAEINNNEAFNVSHYANELQLIKAEIENL